MRRCENEHAFTAGRDIWYHDLVADQPTECPPEEMDAEDILYLLYTSGTTGKPKGIVHTTGGYLTQVAATHRMIFDIHDDDVFWCAADCGWVTGHSYIVYGPLANHTTGIMYEGAPDWPDKDRWWSIVETYGATILYTAPTAIRAFMRWGTEFPEKHDLSSLRLLGSVGEPINPEAWVWYWKVIGGERAPVVDTWWQTETGAILITPLPGITVSSSRGRPPSRSRGSRPTSTTMRATACRWAAGATWSSRGRGPRSRGRSGAMPDRYVETYFSKYGPEVYVAGDGAKRDEDGFFWLLGRIDDVMNVAGHRLSTFEIESALVDNDKVAEAAVVSKTGRPRGRGDRRLRHPEVRLRGRRRDGDRAAGARRGQDREDRATARDHLHRPTFRRPARARSCADCSATWPMGVTLGDVTTLANAEIVEQIRDMSESAPTEE